jgi:hypothetical protein
MDAARLAPLMLPPPDCLTKAAALAESDELRYAVELLATTEEPSNEGLLE